MNSYGLSVFSRRVERRRKKLPSCCSNRSIVRRRSGQATALWKQEGRKRPNSGETYQRQAAALQERTGDGAIRLRSGLACATQSALAKDSNREIGVPRLYAAHRSATELWRGGSSIDFGALTSHIRCGHNGFLMASRSGGGGEVGEAEERQEHRAFAGLLWIGEASLLEE